MAYSALSILLQSLEAYSNPNGRLAFVRSEKLQSLTENLKFFQDFLQNSGDKCYDKDMMSSIEGKILEVVPKARHVIQEFARSTRRSKDLLIDIFDEKCSIHQILEQILQEIDSIKAEAINFGVTMSTMPKNTISVKDGIKMLIDFNREDGDSTDEENALFNFDKGMRIILDRLLSSSSSSSVLEFASIFVGDAEREMQWEFALHYLAENVLRHPSVVSYFQIRVRVSLSEIKSKPYTTGIYYFLGGKAFSRSYYTIRDLVKALHEELKSHRFLVVVENHALSSRYFLHIKSWLPEDYNGSRVILCNIPLDVTATLVHSHSSVDSPVKSETFSVGEHFGEFEAWEYLLDKVFARGSRPPDKVADIGKQIAKNCQGVRGVLDQAAELLSQTNMSIYEWEKIEKRIGYGFPGFFPEKTFYIFYDMLQLSVEVDCPMIGVKKEKENAVVGLDDDLIKIKHQLTGQSSHLEIISVVGMGGIGKTALAEAVFDDPLVQYHFYIRAWIKASPVYQLRYLLLGVLQSICHLDDQIHGMNTEQLKEKIHRKLKGQRFLIVMDDLWSTVAWDSMRRCFPDDNNGSRILLTTRLKNLAAHVSSNHTPHEMKLLDKEQSWELMHYQISASINKICPDELVEIGKEIAEKCQGLPLSILVIAGVLSNMSETRDSWEKVAENMNSLFARDPEKCIEILALSYNYLPHHLKACFLYMCAFPEDCEIDCQRLYQLWVAEGFVKAESDRNLEDLAEQYLEDLVKRSLVLVGRRRSDGGIKTCQLHDVLRELALREAQKENFMQVITSNIQVHSKGDVVPCRLSFHCGSCSNFQPDPTVQLNSFLCFDVGFGSIPDISFTLSNFNFKLLRVLDINFLRFDYFPDLILNLVHLRFLALTAACELPSLISNLLNLQTLIVHGPWLSRKHGKTPILPMEIWRMTQLRHLNLSAAILLGSPLLDEDDASNSLFLTSLHTLSTIRSRSCTEQLFRSLPSLKKLGIRQIREDLDTKNGSYDFLKSLLCLHQLETLKCCFYVQNRKPMQLPVWQAFPQRVKKLTISGGNLPWTEMETLGMLPNLEILKLKNYAFQGPIWEANEDGFQSLKVLLIDKLDLVHWNAYRYSFPRLESLILSFCESLEEIPNDIADDMQLIELHYCSPSAERSAREIQEEQRSRDNVDLVVRIISERKMASVESNDS